jgi:hypothetical protein
MRGFVCVREPLPEEDPEPRHGLDGSISVLRLLRYKSQR